MKSPAFFGVKPLTDLPGWYAGNDGILGYVLDHLCTSRNNCAIPDFYATRDQSAVSYPHVAADHRSLWGGTVCMNDQRLWSLIVDTFGDYGHLRREHCIRADLYVLTNKATMIDETVRPSFKIARHVTVWSDVEGRMYVCANRTSDGGTAWRSDLRNRKARGAICLSTRFTTRIIGVPQSNS